MSNGCLPGEDGPDQPSPEDLVLESDADRTPLAGAGELNDRLRRTHAELEASRAALAESEGRYRAIVESASDYAIMTTDLSGHLTSWSSGACRVFGWEEAEVLGRACSLLWTSEDCEAGLPEAEMQQAIARGVVPDERWHVRRDGTRIWTSGQVTLLRDGATPGFLKILRDRTAQRSSEEQTRESEERLRLIVESARDYAIFTLDLQGRVTSWNSGAARILGWAEADIMGHDASILYTPEDVGAGEPQTEMNSALAQGHVDGGRWMLRRDGTCFWATQTITRLQDEDGAGRGFLKILRDCTEQRMAEEALRESEARFRHMADSAPALIWMTDGDGGFTFANRHFTHLFGRPAAEFLGDGWKQLVLPEDAERFGHVFMDAFHARRPFQAEVQVRDKKGEVRWLRCEGVPRFDDAGRFLGYTGCDVDITEARLAAEELERRVAARTAELSHALGQLHEQVLEREQAEEQLRQAQKMEAVGQLTGGIAHDFNNMLQGIAGSLELMQRRVAQGQAGEAARFVGAARQGVNRAAALTNRLLAFARRQALQPGRVDAGKLIRDMDELIRRTMGPAIAMDLRLHDGIGTVLCDANQLENVLLNLCINARDAMPDGGTLTIATADRLLARADLPGQDDAKPGQYVEVSVADTGTGMTADVLAHAFEPFFTTKPAGQGTGLGLSQLYGFVRQSGGIVRLESRPGEGTMVRLYLPCHAGAGAGEPEDAGAVAGAAINMADAAGRTVLVVEDEASVRVLITEVLQELGCLVREAEDGPAGLRILQSGEHVDLLVTDVGLPGLNGRQLADAARATRPVLPVLLITGYAGAALDEMGLAPGMQVMGKPFTLDALASRVRTMLEAPPTR